MKSIKVLLFLCFAVLFSCKENKVEAQKANHEQQKISVTDLKTKIEHETLQLIDVRTPNEYKEGHIAYAQNVNFYDSDFLTQLNKLDKNKPVYLYCKSGGRSAKASKQLHKAGFKVLYDVTGGFSAWETAGFSIKK